MRARLHGDLYFAALLDEQHILEAFGPARSFWQGWLYTPAVTPTWVFLSQCLSLGPFLSRCGVPAVRLAARPRTQAVLARHGARFTACREMLCSNRRAANWFATTGRESEAQSPAEWLWHESRRVRCVVDGSTITMPDTPENQAEYPASQDAEARLRASHRADPGHLLVGHGRGVE